LPEMRTDPLALPGTCAATLNFSRAWDSQPLENKARNPQSPLAVPYDAPYDSQR
jgi:hypothetical protein